MNASLASRITIEPGKHSGKPCIRGLRITVSDVLEYLASVMTVETQNTVGTEHDIYRSASSTFENALLKAKRFIAADFSSRIVVFYPLATESKPVRLAAVAFPQRGG